MGTVRLSLVNQLSSGVTLRCRRIWGNVLTGSEGGCPSLHYVIRRRPSLVLLLSGMVLLALTLLWWDQMILHRDWGLHWSALRDVVRVNRLRLLLVLHPGMWQILSWPWRPLLDVLRRTRASLLTGVIRGEPGS